MSDELIPPSPITALPPVEADSAPEEWPVQRMAREAAEAREAAARPAEGEEPVDYLKQNQDRRSQLIADDLVAKTGGQEDAATELAFANAAADEMGLTQEQREQAVRDGGVHQVRFMAQVGRQMEATKDFDAPGARVALEDMKHDYEFQELLKRGHPDAIAMWHGLRRKAKGA